MPPTDPTATLRTAALDLCRFAGRFLAGDSDVDRGDVQVAIDEVLALASQADDPSGKCKGCGARMYVGHLALNPGCAALYQADDPSGPDADRLMLAMRNVERRQERFIRWERDAEAICREYVAIRAKP